MHQSSTSHAWTINGCNLEQLHEFKTLLVSWWVHQSTSQTPSTRGWFMYAIQNNSYFQGSTSWLTSLPVHPSNTYHTWPIHVCNPEQLHIFRAPPSRLTRLFWVTTRGQSMYAIRENSLFLGLFWVWQDLYKTSPAWKIQESTEGGGLEGGWGESHGKETYYIYRQTSRLLDRFGEKILVPDSGISLQSFSYLQCYFDSFSSSFLFLEGILAFLQVYLRLNTFPLNFGLYYSISKGKLTKGPYWKMLAYYGLNNWGFQSWHLQVQQDKAVGSYIAEQQA